LVFVFAFTQVTTLLLDHVSWGGLGRGPPVLVMLWWAWASYAWLTNTIDAEAGPAMAVILIAIGAMFVAALAVPEAFTAHRLVFGLAFFVVLCSPARDTGARALRRLRGLPDRVRRASVACLAPAEPRALGRDGRLCSFGGDRPGRSSVRDDRTRRSNLARAARLRADLVARGSGPPAQRQQRRVSRSGSRGDRRPERLRSAQPLEQAESTQWLVAIAGAGTRRTPRASATLAQTTHASQNSCENCPALSTESGVSTSV
jgi:hypothetical protein